MDVQEYNCVEETCSNERKQVMPIKMKYTIKWTARRCMLRNTYRELIELFCVQKV